MPDPNLTEFIKNIKKRNYEQAIIKETTKKTVKDAVQDPVKKEADRLKNKRLLEEEKVKLKQESGDDATDRLLNEYSQATGKVYTSSGQPKYPDDFPSSDFGFKGDPYLKSGYPDSPSAIGIKRMAEIKGQLKVAQSAKDEKISFEQAQRIKTIKDKYAEFYKEFNRPEVHPKKVQYLTDISTREWYNKTYGK